MTAKEFEKQYGFGYSNRKSLWIGEFCFLYIWIIIQTVQKE